MTLQEYAYKHMEAGIPGLAKYLADYIKIKYPGKI